MSRHTAPTGEQVCEECGTLWDSALAADSCAEEDRAADRRALLSRHRL